MPVSLKQHRPPSPNWVVAEEVNLGPGYGEESIAGEGGVRFTIDHRLAPSSGEVALSKVCMRYQGEKPHFAFLVLVAETPDDNLVQCAVDLLKHCFKAVAYLRGDEYVVVATDGSVHNIEVGDVIEAGGVNPPKSRAPTG